MQGCYNVIYVLSRKIFKKVGHNTMELDKKSSQPPYILGHNSTSIWYMESYDMSVDAQSNLAYYEYYLSVLVAFLINPYI